MDPIIGATNTVPLQQPEPVQRTDTPAAAAEAPATGVDAGPADSDQAFRQAASAMVTQMYMTIWKEAQRDATS